MSASNKSFAIDTVVCRVINTLCLTFSAALPTRTDGLLCVLLSTLLWIFPAHADNTDNQRSLYQLTVGYYQDDSNQLTVQDFIDNPSLLDRFGEHNGTFSAQPVGRWFFITWDNTQTTDKHYYLQQLFPNNDLIDTHIFYPDGRVATQLAGGTRPFTVRQLPYRLPTAPIDGAAYALVKVIDPSNAPMPVTIVTKAELEQQQQFDMVWYSAFVAAILILVIYHFFIYFFLNDISYLYYVFYLLSLGLLPLQMSGIGQQYLWPQLSNSSHLLGLSLVTFANVSTVLFADSFLQQAHKNVLLKRLAFGLAGLALVNYAAFFIPALSVWTILVVQLLTLLIMPVVYLLVLVSFFRGGDRSARLLVLTYFLIFPGVIMSIFRYNNIVPNNFFTEHFIEISIVIEAILLSVGLADRINILRQQKIATEHKNQAMQKQFVAQLLASQEREKRVFGEILHDSINHKLLLLKMAVPSSAENATVLDEKIKDIINDVRDLSHQTHPYLVERLGLKAALENLIKHVEKSTHVTIHDRLIEADFDAEQQILLYRIVQESLNNLLKHADTSECFIVLSQTDDTYTLTIKDNGKGFSPAQTTGFGLQSIKERAKVLNADFHLTAAPGQGTTLMIKNIPAATKDNADRQT